MKKILFTLAFVFSLIPAFTFASIQTLPWWHDSSGFSYPYVSSDLIKVKSLTATSTLDTSVFNGYVDILKPLSIYNPVSAFKSRIFQNGDDVLHIGTNFNPDTDGPDDSSVTGWLFDTNALGDQYIIRRAPVGYTSSSEFVDLLTVNGTGDVGVGTSPAKKLDVAGTIRAGDASTVVDILADISTGAIVKFGSVADPANYMQLGAFGGINQINTKGRNFRLSSTADTVGVNYLAASGNLGIGTTSPFYKLSVEGDASFANNVRANYFTATSTTATSTIRANLTIGNPSATLAPRSLVINDFGSSNNPVARFEYVSGTGAIEIIGNSSSVSSIYFGDTTDLDLGRIIYNNSASASGANAMRFVTANTEKMRINSSGFVGIGTTSPFAKLSVTGTGTGTGKAVIIEDSTGRDIFQINDNGNVKIGSSTPTTSLLDVDGVISSGADGNIGGGEIRSYQTPGFYVSMKTDTSVNKSGLLRSNAGGDKYFTWYNTSSGDTGLATVGGAGANILFYDNTREAMRIRNSMVSIGAAKFPAHTLDITQPEMSTAKTASYDAIKASNTATSSTASVRMSGIETVVTGANSGAGASNVGVYVSSVSGGTANYDAIFNGTGVVGIGTTTPNTRLQVNGTTATSTISATVVNGSTRSTTIGGNIILQDMNGGTCTEITTQSGNISSRAVACP